MMTIIRKVGNNVEGTPKAKKIKMENSVLEVASVDPRLLAEVCAFHPNALCMHFQDTDRDRDEK